MTTVIDIIIAILAFVIATIQFIVQIKEWSNKKRKDKLSKGLDAEAEKVTSMFEEFNKILELIDEKKDIFKILYLKNIEYYNDGNTTHLREELCEIKKYYSSISECFKELQDIILHTKVEAKKMLELLLSCESEFSLSYGFDRYIKVTRDLSFGTWFSANEKKICELLSENEKILLELQELLQELQESQELHELENNGTGGRILMVKNLTMALVSDNPRMIRALTPEGCKEVIPVLERRYEIFAEGWEAYNSIMEVMKSSTPMMEEMKLKF